MSEQHVRKFRDLVARFLEPGEEILDIAPIQPTRGASVSGYGMTRVVGEAIAGIGAVKGGPGSIAASFPDAPGIAAKLLCATDRRALFVLAPSTHSAEREAKGLSPAPRLLWAVPRSYVAGVERRPRLQMMAKLRLHFVDGSSVSVMTMRRGTIESLAGVLGGHQK